MTTEAPTYRDVTTDQDLNREVCAWLRANGVDPDLLPREQRPRLTPTPETSRPKLDHDAPMVLDLRLHVRGEYGMGVRLNKAHTALVEQQHTVPIRVDPPSAVLAWLKGRCPTCDR